MANVTMNEQGRIFIPSALRKELHFNPNADLVATVENGMLIVETREHLEKRLWAVFDDVDGSMADELMVERRIDAALEDSE